LIYMAIELRFYTMILLELMMKKELLMVNEN
jgi:hypothetical protein